MHAPDRMNALAHRGLNLILGLSLVIASGVARAHPVQIGSHMVDIPAPGQLVEVSSDDPATDMMLKTMGMSADQAMLIFADTASVDAKPGSPPKVHRLAIVKVLPSKLGDPLPDSLFDKSSPMASLLERMTIEGIRKAGQHDARSGGFDVVDNGMFRQIPWGVFFSFDMHSRNPLAAHPVALGVSMAILKINHTMLMAYTVSAARDAMSVDSQWSQKTLSDWADTIHEGADGIGMHASALYKAVPWIVLLVLLVLGYFLFFKKSEKR